jgi:hypothetical protein
MLLYQQALRAAEGTGLFEEARLAHDRCQKKCLDQIEASLAPVDEALRAACQKEDFRRALDLLEAARKTQESPERNRAIERRIRQTMDRGRCLFEELEPKAREAARRKDAVELGRLRSRVDAWGVPEWRTKLDRALEADALAVAPPPSPKDPPRVSPSELEKAYRGAWTRAMAQATAGDPRAAAEELRPLGHPPPGAGAPAELAQDLEDLKLVAALVQEGQEALSHWPRGQKISLEFRNEAGHLERIENAVVKGDAFRIGVKKDAGCLTIPLGEISGATLARLAPSSDPKSKERFRAAALLCLLQGDPEGALALGAEPSSIPEKYWAYARAVKSALESRDSESAKMEGAARRSFYRAEACYGDPRQSIEATQLYKSLLDGSAATDFVRRNRAAIVARTGPVKDYVLSPLDLGAAGAFQWATPGKTLGCWVSQKDSDPGRILENYVEASFYAFPGVEYRCWIYAGACCSETFACSYQASELSGPSAKNPKETVSCESGSSQALPVRLSINFLKKTHAQHVGPKAPVRWEWLSLPLPKFGTPGLKSLRVLSDQQGFAVSFIVVSAARQGPPVDSDLKEFEKTLGDRIGTRLPLASGKDASLVGHWRLDGGPDGSAPDLSGWGHTASIVHGSWEKGRDRTSLRFNGKDTVATIPSTPKLVFPGDFTLAFCVKKAATAPGWCRIVGKGEGGARNYGIWEGDAEGNHLLFQQMGDKGEEVLHLNSRSVLEIGRWFHVACLIRGNEGFIYINGALEAQATRSGAPATNDNPLYLSFLSDEGHFPLSGWLSDLRIYSRALRDDEIRALARVSGSSDPVAKAPVVSRDAGLVARWTFEEKSGTTAADSTGNQNHGTLRDGALFTAGKGGGGLALDGDAAYVRVAPSPSILSITEQFTVCAWVQRKADQTGWRFVLTKPKLPLSNEELWLGFFDNRPSLGVEIPSGEKELLGPSALPLNQWIHLAGTYDGKALKIFVNGSMQAEQAYAGPIKLSSQPLSIGARINVATERAGYALCGQLDEVRLYNRALSPQEIGALAAPPSKFQRSR